MENNKIKYFTTGELAKLYDINKKTLFHYDDIDLFKPEKVTSNGYRYYSQYQLEMLNVICILKSIGMPLKDIKDFLNKRNPDNVINLFDKEIKEIENEINRLKYLQIMMSNKIKLINEGKSNANSIFIENQDEEYLVLSNSIDNSHFFYDVKTYSDHINYCYNNNLNLGFPAGSIISFENLINKNFKEYSCFFTKVSEDLPKEKITIKPKGKYLVGYAKGYYDKVYLFYDNLMKYIDDNNLKIIGNSYEDVLIDEVSSKNIDEYIIKISIQIQ